VAFSVCESDVGLLCVSVLTQKYMERLSHLPLLSHPSASSVRKLCVEPLMRHSKSEKLQFLKSNQRKKCEILSQTSFLLSQHFQMIEAQTSDLISKKI